MSYLGACQACGNEVDDSFHTACFQITGFEVSRSKGLNRVLHKKRVPNKVWHLTCVDTEVPREQGSLDFGAAA